MMVPADLEDMQCQLFGEDKDDDQSSASEGSSLEDFDGDDAALQADVGEEKSHGQGHVKQFHLSPEWVHLESIGAHIAVVPPVVGCGVNRHPAGQFWSARFPDCPIRTASWTNGQTPFSCLVRCLRHVIKLHLERNKPSNSDTWTAQLEELKQYLA